MATQPVASFGPTMVIQLTLSDRQIPDRVLLDPCAGQSIICWTLAEKLRMCPVVVGKEKFCQVSVASSDDSAQNCIVSARVSVSDSLKDHSAGL